MSKKLTAIAALAAAAATLAAVAAAGPVAGKQRLTIQVARCPASAPGCPFTLTPLGAGPVKPDSGTFTACCWTQRFITRDGQAIEIDNPHGTFTGKRGTFYVSQQIEWVDIPSGFAISTGTWKVVRGTGAYAGLSGGGLHAGIQMPDGGVKFRDDGFFGSK